jgi:uncharacterized protein (TIGR04255 family)
VLIQSKFLEGVPMGEWQPIHDQHAIAVVAVVVTLSGELPERSASRLQQKAVELGSGMGLTSSAPIHGFAVDPSRGMATASEKLGLVINSISDVPKIPGFALDFSKQIQIDRNSLMYRTSVYTRWSAMRGDLEKLVSPLIEMISEIIGVHSIRLEYLDRFFFTGDINEASVQELISPECQMIAPHIFGEAANWHSHSGSARPVEPAGATAITHVNVDAKSLTQRGTSGAKRMRVVNLMTAREDRNPFGKVAESDYNADLMLKRLDEMHDELKKMISDILVLSVQEKIGMGEQ